MITDLQKEGLLKENEQALDISMSILRDVSEKRIESRQNVIRHIYQLITAIGVVAGFGFTALPSVQNPTAFILSEFLLLGAMAIGMWFTSPNYLETEKEYADWIHEIQKAIDTRIAIENSFPPEKIFEEFKRANNIEHNVFKSDDDDNNDRPNMDFPKTIFYMFCGGAILLLLSFVPMYLAVLL